MKTVSASPLLFAFILFSSSLGLAASSPYKMDDLFEVTEDITFESSPASHWGFDLYNNSNSETMYFYDKNTPASERTYVVLFDFNRGRKMIGADFFQGGKMVLEKGTTLRVSYVLDPGVTFSANSSSNALRLNLYCVPHRTKITPWTFRFSDISNCNQLLKLKPRL